MDPNEDIPSANEQANEEEKLSPHEKMKRDCFDAIRKITSKNPTVFLTFTTSIDHDLVGVVKEKGFRITYSENFDSSKENPFLTYVRITNPAYKNPASEMVDCISNLFVKGDGDIGNLFGSLQDVFSKSL